MKFFISATFLVFLSLTASAQTRIAIKGGFNYSTARIYTGENKQSTGYMPGGNLGIQLKTFFEGPLHFSPVVSYQTRGFVTRSKLNGDKTSNFIHYIDLAPLLSADLKISNKNSLVFSAGPVASLAIAGTEKVTVNGISTSSRMRFSTTGDYGLFDFAIQAGIGYHLKKIYFEANYLYGLANINNNVAADFKNIRNRTFSLNIGYYLKSYE